MIRSLSSFRVHQTQPHPFRWVIASLREIKPTFIFIIGLFCFAGVPTVSHARVDNLYQQHCAVCHGAQGEGGLGGSLVNGDYQYRPNDQAWAQVIRDGLPDMGMQGFSDVLSEKEIRSMVVYLRELETRAQREPTGRFRAGVIDTDQLSYRLQEVVDNPNRMWGVSFFPDGTPIVTEIDGAVRVLQADGTLGPPLEGTPDVVRKGQGGMLDVAVHPEVEENGWIYLAFSDGEGQDSITSVVRGRIDGNTWTDTQTVYQADPVFRSSRGVHFGTRIVFRDGDVYFAIGDRGRQNEAQDLNRPNGKIHRVNEDGTVPEDNPFRNEGLDTIWSTGHRNPQALAFRPGTDELWSTEHGPRGGDELNLVEKGKNYGWPRVTHGINYNGTPITEHTDLPGLEPPVLHWTPSIAVCGMSFVNGEVYPEWEGDLLVGGLRAQVIERLRIRDGKIAEQEIILKDQGRVRDIKTAPDGTLYVILEGNGSRLVRLIPVRA
jgi:glucose/arabinose dehydrogenase